MERVSLIWCMRMLNLKSRMERNSCFDLKYHLACQVEGLEGQKKSFYPTRAFRCTKNQAPYNEKRAFWVKEDECQEDTKRDGKEGLGHKEWLFDEIL